VSKIDRLLKREGVRPFLTRSMVIDWLQWSQEFAEEQDDRPYMPQVTLSLIAEYKEHVERLEKALAVAVEALEFYENTNRLMLEVRDLKKPDGFFEPRTVNIMDNGDVARTALSKLEQIAQGGSDEV
jgi:hypothetical protein